MKLDDILESLDYVVNKHYQWSNQEKTILKSVVASRLKSAGSDTYNERCLGQLNWVDIAKEVEIENNKNKTSRKRKSMSVVSECENPRCKTAMECVMMYRNELDPSIELSSWTKEEDSQLIILADKYNQHEWCLIASELNTRRSPIACLTRYQSVLTSSMSNSSEWTKFEDELLRNSVKMHGKNWSIVTVDVPGRSAVQCSVRYRKIHCSTLGEVENKGSGSGVKVGKWTRSEEKLLFLAALAYKIPFNTDYKVDTSRIEELVHYLATAEIVRSDRVRGIVNNTSSNDASSVKIKAAGIENDPDTSSAVVPSSDTKNNGSSIGSFSFISNEVGVQESTSAAVQNEVHVKVGTWLAVSQCVPDRNDVQCRDKWMNGLDPTLNHSPQFAAIEDKMLVQLVPIFGVGNWTQISRWFVGRTDNQLMKRYKAINYL